MSVCTSNILWLKSQQKKTGANNWLQMKNITHLVFNNSQSCLSTNFTQLQNWESAWSLSKVKANNSHQAIDLQYSLQLQCVKWFSICELIITTSVQQVSYELIKMLEMEICYWFFDKNVLKQYISYTFHDGDKVLELR